MKSDVVQVPVSLLASPDLPASAKLIWMVARLGPPANQAPAAWLAGATGLSRSTVYSAIAQLTASGSNPVREPGPGATLRIPAALLTNRRLGLNARVLYGFLLLMPGFRHPSGQLTYAELSKMAHASRNTVAKALAQLARAEWIKLERAHRLDRIHFELTFPGLDQGLAALAAAQRRLEKAQYFGEGLMREFLSLLVDSEEFEDDAAPGFLVNPRTGERLQLDRFYPPAVAFEHNGPQHYRGTVRFTAEGAAAQQERDYIKQGICVTRGITLVVVHPEDLTLAEMRHKVGKLLPLRDLTGCHLLIDYLESESRTYRRFAARL